MIEYRVRPRISTEDLNTLFSAGGPGAGWPSWRETPDASDWQSVLAHSLVYICAFDSQRLVGFVNVAWDGRDHAFLLDPRVHPTYRNRGIGKELVRRAAAEAGAAGCEWLHVDYEPGLTPFYEACGFAPTAAGLIRLNEGQ
jgi:ribosomal protein S18 acetylase RimI-like enzyme